MDAPGVATGALGLDGVAGEVLEQRLGDLRARAIAGAEEEDAGSAARGRVAVCVGWDEGEAGVERAAGPGEQLTAAREVNAVVGVAAVEGAAAHRHEAAGAEAAEVVGDEILRLAEHVRELADLAVAAGELAEELPAERVSGELEEGGRGGVGAKVRVHVGDYTSR